MSRICREVEIGQAETNKASVGVGSSIKNIKKGIPNASCGTSRWRLT
jgi:hypothetical protein